MGKYTKRRTAVRTTAVTYARVSPRPEHKRDEETNQVSIGAQHEMAADWCDQHDLEVIGRFDDEFVSGSEDNRPGLEAALKLAIEQNAVLVVYSQNRLARSFSMLLRIVNRVTEGGAAIKTLTGLDMDLDNLDMQLAWKILALLDEYQRMRIGKDTSDKMLSYQRQGKKMGGKPPYGKVLVGDVLEDHPEEQDNINRIIAWHDEGKTIPEIRRLLNESGVAPRGASWYYSTIERILERELV